MRRIALLLGALAIAVVGAAVPVGAANGPDVIPLPDGFQPEGIVVDAAGTFYVGSLRDGSIYRGDVMTGLGEVIFTPSDVRTAVGLWYDRPSGHVFAAGGPFGAVHVYDGATGAELGTYPVAGGFLNDVVVTRTAAYVSDSFLPVIHVLPLGPDRLPTGGVETLALSGDYTFTPNDFNGNGIEATRDGKRLILANSSNGTLYVVDPRSGRAKAIDLGGASLPNADGILLEGRTLYVVQNFLNQIAVVRLAPGLRSGSIGTTITSDDFRIPTTVGSFGDSLYAVNARFDVAPPFDPTVDPTLAFEVVRTGKR